MQTPCRGGLSDSRRVDARNAREVDPPRPSVDTAPVVGAPAARVEPSGVAGAAAARPVRRPLSSGVQAAGGRDPDRRAAAAEGRPGVAESIALVRRGFANWDMAAHPTYLQVGRSLVRAAHGEEAPLVVDPFAGGGSIPLEALRLGCEAFASDLLDAMLLAVPR